MGKIFEGAPAFEPPGEGGALGNQEERGSRGPIHASPERPHEISPCGAPEREGSRGTSSQKGGRGGEIRMACAGVDPEGRRKPEGGSKGSPR